MDIVVQWVRTSWTKRSRGGPGATRCNALPEAIQGRWWTWASSERESTNPVMDTTGKFCGRNQLSTAAES